MQTLLEFTTKKQFTQYLDKLKESYKSISITKINDCIYKVNISNVIDNDLLILINQESEMLKK